MAMAQVPFVLHDEAATPDWRQFSFSDIPLATEGGQFDLAEVSDNTGLEVSDLVHQIGYDPSRSWSAGTPIENILKIGDIASSSTLANWTLRTIDDYVPIDLAGMRLSDIPLLNGESIHDLAFAIPELAGFKLSELRPAFDAVKSVIGLNDALNLSDVAIGDLNVELGSISLDVLDLSEYDLDSIPGIADAPFGDFVEFKDSFISEIPGLKFVPVAAFLTNLLGGGFLAKLDIVYGDKESNRTNTITGSYQEGFGVPCLQEDCAYLELTDKLDFPIPLMHGKQWISGKSQQVSGGEGFLKWVNGGKEPTGRHPFGEAFKVVLTNTDESQGRADFGIYFRVCVDLLFVSGCTPYFIGPFPWFSQKEKDTIFVGVDGVNASVPNGFPALPQHPGVPPELAAQVPELNQGGLGDTSFADPDCQTYNSVDFAALKRTIAKIESLGSGGALAVGIYLCNSDGCGRALGKYQFMTYRNDVKQVIRSKPGGREFITNIRDNKISISDIKAKLPFFFSLAEQNELFDRWIKQLLDQGYHQGIRGQDLVHYVMRRYGGGYAERGTKAYQDEKQKSTCTVTGDGKCHEKYVHPASGFRQTDRFGTCRPLGSCTRPHEGVDVGTPIGTPIKASNGGKVVYSARRGGYGIAVDIKHCDGRTTRYAHLNKSLVSVGQTVSQNQVIAHSGQTGLGSGPHLHFEIRDKNGIAVNPKIFIKEFN